MSKVPKLYKLSFNKLFSEYFRTNDYNKIVNLYGKIVDMKDYSLPIEEWDSLYAEMYVMNDDQFSEFIENKMDDYEFAKKQILKNAEDKFVQASFQYLSRSY